MSEALERILANVTLWAGGKPLAGEWNRCDIGSYDDLEYILIDVHRAEVEAAVKRALEGAAQVVMEDYEAVVAEQGERSGTALGMREDAKKIRALDPAQFVDGEK